VVDLRVQKLVVTALEGEIVYSDYDILVGRRFPPTDDLEAALAGSASAEVNDLSAEENRFDRDLGSRLIEFYVPVHAASGEVVGVFEIYQDYGPLESRLASIQRIVWTSVAGDCPSCSWSCGSCSWVRHPP